MGGNSSFYYTNPTPEVVPGLSAEITALTTASNALLDEYAVQTNTWASSVTIDWDLALTHRITLTGTPTTFTFTGGRNGAKYVLEIKQDATGNRSFTLPAKVRYGTYIPNIDPSTSANKTDKLGFIYDSAADKYDLVAVAYGF
jgi:hypothetical protein